MLAAFNSRAQISLEYLLLLAAFFAAFAVLLPVISDSAKNFLFASDVVLAKRISEELNEQISLMDFLADGSAKTFEYFPSGKIILYSRGSEVVVETGEREFAVKFSSSQVLVKQEFTKKFMIKLEKYDGVVRLSAFQAE